MVSLFEEARRAATLELLRPHHVSDHTLRTVLQLPAPLTYRDIVRTLQNASPQTAAPFSIGRWRSHGAILVFSALSICDMIGSSLAS